MSSFKREKEIDKKYAEGGKKQAKKAKTYRSPHAKPLKKNKGK
jgi:hypothetical protein